jgi:hypothetical protein
MVIILPNLIVFTYVENLELSLWYCRHTYQVFNSG